MTNSWITVCPLIVCLVLGIKAKPSSHQSIGNAKGVDIEDFPWHATLTDSNLKERPPCAAAIISEKYVVTAAICTYFGGIETLHVTVGSSIYEEGTRYKLKSVHQHPNFTIIPQLPYNIAVIELDEEIKFDETKHPIVLPDKDVPVGAKVTVIGWGTRSWKKSSEHLKKQDLIITDRQTCNTIIADIIGNDIFVPLDSSKICGLPEPDTPPCEGNLGSGVIYNKTLVGVYAGGSTCDDGNPEIMTLVHEQVEWIRKVISI